MDYTRDAGNEMIGFGIVYYMEFCTSGRRTFHYRVYGNASKIKIYLYDEFISTYNIS